jgi:hypothetical protein
MEAGLFTKSPQMKRRLLRSLYILVGAGTAAFLTMIIVQSFMGGIQHIDLALGKSFMIGFGIAVFVFLLPAQRNERYPWQ